MPNVHSERKAVTQKELCNYSSFSGLVTTTDQAAYRRTARLGGLRSETRNGQIWQSQALGLQEG